MERFYWLVDGVLAGCCRPGGRPGSRRSHVDRSPDERAETDALNEDLAWLRQQGIGAILSLTETPLDEETLAAHGVECLHLPIPDMQAPHPEQFVIALDFLDRQRSQGAAVAVHCLMGQGRTGTILAATLIREGRPADEAIAHLRAICPGAIESEPQKVALRAYASRRDWIL